MRTVLFVLLSVLLVCCEQISESKTVFLGDSITYGWDTEMFFPMADTYNMGVSGTRIQYITTLNRDFSEFNTVVIMMGANDLNHGLTSESKTIELIDKYISTYKQVIENIKSQHIIVISVLPMFNTDKVRSTISNNQIDLMNKQLALLPDSYPFVEFVDANSHFKDKNGELDMNYSTDGVHLNVFGYRLLSKLTQEPISVKLE